jgi:hypothetical protein
MASLKNDPAVQELVAKAVTKAVKYENKRVLTLIKSSSAADVAALKEAEDKAGAKAAASVAKNIAAAVKLAA